MARKRKLYELTEEDIEVFRAGTFNANAFTDYYFRTPRTGTDYAPSHSRYPEIEAAWKAAGEPYDLWEFEGEEWSAVWGADELPFFRHHHGFRFIPWQLGIHHCIQKLRCCAGGFSCLDVNAKIYEADLQTYVTVQWLLENEHAPTVLSKTVNGWEKVKASMPYFEGTEGFYRVTTSSGKMVDVSAHHRFLTTQGWRRTLHLQPGDELVAPDMLPASVPYDGPCAQNYSETVPDCQDDYWLDCRQRDALLRHQLTDDLAFSPSQADVSSPIRCFFYAPYSLEEQEPQCTPPSLLRSSSGTTRLMVHHAEPGFPRRWRDTSAAPARTALASQVLRQSWSNSNRYWRDVLFSPPSDLEPTGSYSRLADLVEWSYQGDECSRRDSWGTDPGPSMLLQVSHVCQLAFELPSESVSSCSPFQNCTTTDTIVSISYIGRRDAYDIHVPMWNNYVAEGLVHHNSGKSLGMVVSTLVLAATIEEFKAMLTAPSFFQAKVLYQMAVDIMTNTVFEERFLLSSVSAPFPIITIGNSHVGESTLEFKSVSDDGEGILSWRGDVAVVDQAELIPDIKLLRKNLGSRLVGKARCGRHHMGIMQWVANAGPSPRFWDLYGLGKTQPEKAVAITVTSYDNPHNSKEDLEWLEEEVGGTQEAIDQWMLAKKPIVDGAYFSNDTLAKCRAKELEKLMADGLKEERMGFVFEEDGTGIYKWFTPYEHGRSYLVVGDPGQANRPDRNSPVIGVFDITEWPTFAYLRGFHWMDGNASITPFLAEFQLLVEKYHAHGQCAFDSTGTQTTLDELAFDFNDLMVEGMNFGQLKMIMLNALRILMEHGKMRYPYIGGIWDQLGNYNLPDKKLRQDIVSMLMMAAHWLRMNMQEPRDEEETDEDAIPVDRDGHALADRSPSMAR